MVLQVPALDTTRRWTADEVRALPDEVYVQCQLLNGELVVSPSPKRRHQAIVKYAFYHLYAYLSQVGLQNTVYFSPADISWNKRVLVQPDVFVITPEEAHGEWSDVKTLLLAVEVMSPSSRRYDREVKRAIYQKNGVRTYWIVDPFKRLIEVWHPNDRKATIVTEGLRWRVGPEFPEVTISVPELMEAA